MRFPVRHPSSLIRRSTLRGDAMAGLALGVESVPDGLAAGVLAGVNPLAGLYGYLFGMVGATLFTSTTLMAVQATGAMAVVISDVGLEARDDPMRSLFTLSMLTGVVMIAAGVLRLGRLLRFVSNSVMTGFVTAVGINIVLGQLDNLTGYPAEGANRVLRALDHVVHLGRTDWPTLLIGLFTIAVILLTRRTRIGAMGLVLAVVAASVLAAISSALGHPISTVDDVVAVPSSLPLPQWPLLREVPSLLVPAASLALVGLVQGAGVSAGLPNPEGDASDISQDFVAQGAGNIASGLFQGMPVGGSMSASSLATQSGARSRTAFVAAGTVMAVVIVGLADAVGHVATPALGGLLIVVGAATVKPAKVRAVARTGPVPLTVMASAFVLTLLIPLQYAVLVGVAISVLLVVVGQASRVTTRQLTVRDDGRVIETDPPDRLPADRVVVLQPYGAIFFASANVLRERLPAVTPASRHAVVVLRLRGGDPAGATLLDVLADYAGRLRSIDGKLVIVSDNDRFLRQLDTTGVAEVIGNENLYRGTEVIGETTRRARRDAVAWIAAQDRDDST